MITIQGQSEKKAGIHYEVDETQAPLGVGGMGQVFKGVRVNERNGVRSEVAIKFLYDDLPKNVLQRAIREASIQIKNQNLLEMMGFIQVDDVNPDGTLCSHYHVVSELLYGVSLFDFLQRNFIGTQGRDIGFARQLYDRYQNDKNEVSAEIVKNILSALMALHDAGFVHRDVDTTNIMITDTGAVKLIDFGIAKKIETLSGTDAGLTTSGQFMGKAAYAAPELVLGDVPHQNATTDIYALGILLFQLVTGKLPFVGSIDEVLSHQRFDKLPLEQISDRQLRKIIAKATEKRQSLRFQTAAEFRVALDNYICGKNSGSQAPNFIQKHRRALLAAFSCIGLFVVVGFSAKYFADKKRTLEEQEAYEAVRIAERCRVLTDSHAMIDSMKPDSICFDEIVDTFRIRSVGYYTQSAITMIESGRCEEADSLLTIIADKKYTSSATAVLIQAQQIFQEACDASDQETRKNLLETAHNKKKLAVQLDSTLYQATYELAIDYLSGVRRTGSQERDMPSASKFLSLSKKFAEINADSLYCRQCDSVYFKYQGHFQ